MNTQMELTADEVFDIDKISAQRKAIKDTLQVALQYNTNQNETLIEHDKKFWKKIVQSRNLNPLKAWMIDRSRPTLFIREMTEDDKESL